MASKFSCQVIPNVEARVSYIDDKFLRLSSESIGETEYIKISATLASSAFPRRFRDIPSLKTIFSMEDEFLLDISRDQDYYIPSEIFAIKMVRSNVAHVVGDGMIINIADDGEVTVRSRFLPDFKLTEADCITEDGAVRRGAVVRFEAIFSYYGTSGISARVLGGYVGYVIPLRTGDGIVIKDPSGSCAVRFIGANGETCVISIYAGALYGCGVPVSALVGERIRCTICPKDTLQSWQSLTDFEVVYFEPCTVGKLPDNELAPAAISDGVWARDGTMYTGVHEVEASANFNGDVMKQASSSFLFSVERMKPKCFKFMVTRFSHFVSTMVDELGLADVAPAGPITIASGDDSNVDSSDHQQVDLETPARAPSLVRMPTAPDFRPDDLRVPTAPDFPPDDLLVPTALGYYPDRIQVPIAPAIYSDNSRVPTAPDFFPDDLPGWTLMDLEHEIADNEVLPALAGPEEPAIGNTRPARVPTRTPIAPTFVPDFGPEETTAVGGPTAPTFVPDFGLEQTTYTAVPAAPKPNQQPAARETTRTQSPRYWDNKGASNANVDDDSGPSTSRDYRENSVLMNRHRKESSIIPLEHTQIPEWNPVEKKKGVMRGGRFGAGLSRGPMIGKIKPG